MICQHANRHWGFNKSVLVQIMKTLFLPILLYAGHIWISTKNIVEINSLLYKIMKSAIGAVLNIRQSYAELILGLPPIHILTKINKIKHYLKINMTNLPEDKLRDLIKIQLDTDPTSETYQSIRDVFKYLKWKTQNYPDQVNNLDKIIIDKNSIEDFFKISPETCKYTKGNIQKYTEFLWQASLQNELQLEGYNIIPEARCTQISTSNDLNRREEVLVMSLFYPNNILNSSLHKINKDKFPTPMCHCGEAIQTAHHLLFMCNYVEETLRINAFHSLQEIVGNEAGTENHLVLLKARNNQRFMTNVREILRTQSNYLKADIIL